MPAKKKRKRKTEAPSGSQSCHKDKPFLWNKEREEAAALLAEDELTDVEIAEKAGISRRQLFNWKAHPDFAARIAALARQLGNVTLRNSIAKRQRRVRALDQRWQALQQIAAERGASEAMQDVPGGKTGFLVHDVKSIGSGESAERVDLYEVDTGLLRELREHEKQAAQETGQWVEKIAPVDPTGENEYAGLTDAERAARIDAIFNAAAEIRASQTSGNVEGAPVGAPPG